jgi:hypothetical protein
VVIRHGAPTSPTSLQPQEVTLPTRLSPVLYNLGGQKFDFFLKSSLCISDPEYRLYNQEIQSFGHKLAFFLIKPKANTFDFESKFEKN